MSDIAPTPDVNDFAATGLMFRQDSYQTTAKAKVIGVIGNALLLDQTLFYAASGGQPSDHGSIARGDGLSYELREMRYLDAAKTRIGHMLPEGTSPDGWLGADVTLALDFTRRLKLMRMHSALHLLSVVLPYGVTGGAVNPNDGRLDFDIPEGGLDKDEITQKLNALIAHNAEIRDRLITDEELDANPGLVKTMSVKPPRGTGTIRLVEIEGLDLQPCGGTHVRNTREIGPMQVTSIEKKGKLNRRVRIAFA
jgi:misacylated tRNA(Ala) deacylase